MNNQSINAFRIGGRQKCSFSLLFDAAPVQSAFYRHDHPCYELYVLLEGDVEMDVDGTIYPLAPSDLLVIPQGVPHRLRLKSQAPYRRIVAYVFDAYLRSSGLCAFADLLQKGGVIRQSVAASPFLQTLPHCAALAALAVSDTAQELLFNDRLLSLFYALQESTADRKLSAGDALVERALALVNENLSQRLSLDSIAERLYTSPSHLRKSFRRKIGMPLMHYVNAQRVQMAKGLLIGGMPAGEVCRRCGFENYVTFFRTFRAETGLSPTDFAKLC